MSFSMNAKELADYRGKQISMIPQNPMTAFAPMVKLGKQLEWGFDSIPEKNGTTFVENLRIRWQCELAGCGKKFLTVIRMSFRAACCRE